MDLYHTPSGPRAARPRCYSGVGHGETSARGQLGARHRRPRVRWRRRRTRERLRRVRARRRARRPRPRQASGRAFAVRPRRHRVDRDAVARPGRAALPVLRTLRRMSASTPRLSRATRLQGEAGARLPRADRRSRRVLQSETMNALLALFRGAIRARGLSVYDVAASAGLLRFVSLREGHHTGEAMVSIVAASPDVETLTPLAEGLARRVPATASVVLNVNAKKASVAVGTEEHLLLGRDHIRASLGGLSFQVSANSFFQTNAAQAERLFAVVEDACSLSGT